MSKQLIVEIDGGYHFTGEQPQLDAERTKELEEQGFKILRFTNEEVIGDIDNVLKTIINKLNNEP